MGRHCFLQNALRASPAILANLVDYTRVMALAAAAGHHTPNLGFHPRSLYLRGRANIANEQLALEIGHLLDPCNFHTG